jgi:sterol desaturase/sphingolipid hydroxylase (fatty acid hydroxylase superfamily)
MDVLSVVDNVAIALGAAFYVFLPLELWRRYRRGEFNRSSLLEMGASVSPLLGVIVFNGAVIAFITGLFSIVSGLVPWQIPTTLATATLCLVLVDLIYYVDHYCGHRFRLYWALSHSVHHSSPQFDQTTALRVSALDGFTSPWFLIPALLVGFDPLLVLACFVLVLCYQQWIHTETIGSVGWFDAVLNSPSNHRVHHGREAQYLDRNYGGILIIWDRIFGTYSREDVRPTYGLVEPLASHNPIRVHVHEAVRLFSDLKRSASISEVMHHLFARPGAPFARGERQGTAL